MSKILTTKNYSRFSPHEQNRPIVNNSALEKSMKKHGWIKAFPAYCVKNGHNKLKIKAGNHRFAIARKLGIPIVYTIDQDDISINELEQSTKAWKLSDFLHSYCQTGDNNYLCVKEFKDRYNIPLSCCISLLLGGATSGGLGANKIFREGRFKIQGMEHAEKVGMIVLESKNYIPFYNVYHYVLAISACCRVPEFDPRRYLDKLRSFPSMLVKQPDIRSYIQAIEILYNYYTNKKIPLLHMAYEAGRQRRGKRLLKNG